MDTNVLTVALLILGGAIVLWGIFIARSRSSRTPGALLGIPHAMRPGAPDSTLEGKRLERIQIGGVLFTLVTAVYWLPEANRQASFQERFDEKSVERGKLVFQQAPPLEEDAEPVAFREEERAISLGMLFPRAIRRQYSLQQQPRYTVPRPAPSMRRSWAAVVAHELVHCLRSTHVSGAPTLWNAGC